MRSAISGQDRLVSSVTPTITAGAYTTGTTLGGIMTFASAFKAPGGSGELEQVTLTSKTVISSAPDLFLFSVLPTGTYTDAGTFALTAADAANLLGVVSLSQITAAGSTIGDVLQPAVTQQPLSLFNNDSILSQNLYGILVCRSSTTFGSTSDITATVTVKQPNA